MKKKPIRISAELKKRANKLAIRCGQEYAARLRARLLAECERRQANGEGIAQILAVLESFAIADLTATSR